MWPLLRGYTLHGVSAWHSSHCVCVCCVVSSDHWTLSYFACYFLCGRVRALTLFRLFVRSLYAEFVSRRTYVEEYFFKSISNRHKQTHTHTHSQQWNTTAPRLTIVFMIFKLLPLVCFVVRSFVRRIHTSFFHFFFFRRSNVIVCL